MTHVAATIHSSEVLSNAPFDYRVHAWRRDLADVELRGVMPPATRYVTPIPRQCVRGVATLYAEPQTSSAQVSEVRYGEFVDVYEIRPNGFAWVRNSYDRYVGYLANASQVLSDQISALSNRVIAVHSLIYKEPSARSGILDRLTLGSHVGLVSTHDGFYELASGGFVVASHVATMGQVCESDPIITASRCLGVPYLWGGRTTFGIDCSGLVQLSFELAGFEMPRDSDQQEASFGQPLQGAWSDHPWQRGDVVFFDKHVGMMTDSTHMIHANAYTMTVSVEPLDNVIGRGFPVRAWGRMR